MNILQQLHEARLRAKRNSLAGQKLEVRKYARWVKEQGYRVKDGTVWCPNCQQWAYPWIGTCCAECHCEIPELRAKAAK
jgi:hypothetical protein